MKDAANSEQRLGMRTGGFAGACARYGVQICRVEGCAALSEAGQPYCAACAEDIAELHTMWERPGDTESMEAWAFAYVCRAAWRWMWVLLTAGVIAALVAFWWPWAAATVEWLHAGGVAQ